MLSGKKSIDMKKNYVSVIFDRRKRVAVTGVGKVEIHIYFNRTERKYIPIKDCNLIAWRKYERSEELQQSILLYTQVIEQMEQHGEELTIANFEYHCGAFEDKDSKDKRNILNNPYGFIDFMRECIAKEKIARTTEKHKIGTIDAMIRFGRLARFDQLTPKNIAAFDEFLHKEADRKQCTIFSYHKIVKLYTKLAYQMGYILSDPYDHPLCHFDHGKYAERRPLSEEELVKIRSIDDLSSKEVKARDLFVFCAYTGLAYIDSQMFDYRTMTEEVLGTTYIDGRRIKTGNTYYTPILPPAMEVLKKYNYQLPKMSNQKVNDYLHIIESRLKMNKPLTTHVARHSFATLCLAYDIPIEDVARMMGHSNIRTTQIYAKILKKNIEKHAVALSCKIR